MKQRNKIILLVSALLFFGLIGKSVYSYYFQPGQHDEFAKCLNEKGAVMYGNIQFCMYTKAQANAFGKSFKYLNYKDRTELPGIKVTPTWVINSEWFEGVQSFEKLAALTGCRYS